MADASTATVTPFREVLNFLDGVGLFDVVLPFLLVFTIIFAIMEKTRVLGTEEHDGHKYSKKNLNAMVAFVVAFLVIAAKELVEIINTTVASAVIVLFFSVLFLLLIGAFQKEGQDSVFLEGTWKHIFMIITFLAIVGIFLNAIKGEDGKTWLEKITDFTGGGGDMLVGSILLFAMMIFFIVYATKDNESHGHSGG